MDYRMKSGVGILAAVVAATAGVSQATTYTKANNTTAINSSGSWTGGTAPTSTDVGLWDSTVTAGQTVDVSANYTMGGITISNPGGAIVIGTGVNTLTVGVSGTTSFDLSSATQDLTINTATFRFGPNTGITNNIAVASGRTLTISCPTSAVGGTHTIGLNTNGTTATTGTIIFNGAITSTFGATMGSGSVTLAAANSFSSTFLQTGGTLTINNDAALTTSRYDFGGTGGAALQTTNTSVLVPSVTRLVSSTAAVVQGSGSINFTNTLTNTNGNRTLTNNITGSAVLTLSGTVNLSEGSGNRVLTLNGTGNTVVSGAVVNGSTSTGSGLTKDGTGALTLSGTNTYGGSTTLTGGSLYMNGTHTGAGNYSAALGTTLGGNGTITAGLSTNSMTVNGTLAPGDVSSIGTLTYGVGSGVLAGSAAFDINLSTHTSDKFTVGNALTYGGTLNVTVTGADSNAGSYDLFDFASESGTFSAINVTGLALNQTASFDATTGILSISAVPEPSTLTGFGLIGVMALRRRRLV